MKSFAHQVAALRIYGGSDSLAALPRELDRSGIRRAFVFCSGSVARQPALMQPIRDALGARCVSVFDAVQAHSPVDVVEAGAEALRSTEADAVIAVGGGSAIVTARAAGIIAAERQSAEALSSKRLETGRFVSPKLLAPKLPQFIVPTTPTTAIAKAGAAIFDPAQRRRLAMFDPKTRAQAVFVHPDLAMSAPPALALSASLNALALAVEALESGKSDVLSDAALLHALRLLDRNMPKLSSAADGPEVRIDLILAAILCGQGTNHAAAGAMAAALGHSLGLQFDIANGVANCIVLPHTMRFNRPVTAAQLRPIAEVLGAQPDDGDWAAAAIRAVETLIGSSPVPTRLRDAGVPRDRLGDVAAMAMDDFFMSQTPRRVGDTAEALAVLDAAW